MIEVRTPVAQFFDTDGSPLDAGYIYVGVTGLNPETNPQTIYWDKDGLIPAAQPIRTLNGNPSRDGAAAKFYTSTATYSVTVKDKRGILVVSSLNNDSGIFDELSDTAGAAGVGYNNTASDLTADTVQEAIDELVVDIGAVAADVDSLRSAFSGMVNLFDNSAFLINQRGYVSSTPTTVPNQFTLDRIKVVVSGQSLIFTGGATFGNKITAPAGGAEQVIEGNNIVGGDYACTWVGTGTILIEGVSRAKGETFTLIGGVNSTVTMVGEFEQFSFTRPDMIGRFEYDYAEDISQCRRYAQLNPPGIGLSISTTAVNGIAIPFSPTMRATPSATLISGTSALLEPGVAARNVTSIVVFNGNSTGGYLDLNGTTITNAKQHLLLQGKIMFSADL